MALSYWLDGIEDYKNVVWMQQDGTTEKRMNPATHALIFVTIAVGLGEITIDNVDEFAARTRIIERIDGPFLTARDGADRYFTDADFIAHIGLRTNVHSETRTQWVARVFTSKRTSKTNNIADKFKRCNERKLRELGSTFQ